MKRALYMNKFGIMHKGIIEVIRDIEEAPDVDEIILGICSSQFNDQNKSPEKDWIYNCLSWQERKQVIEASLSEIRKPVIYAPVPDTFPITKSYPENRWIDFMLTQVPEFDILFSERDVEKICLEHKNKEIRDIVKYVGFSDHCIRDKIARGEIWEPYFHPQAVPVLKAMEVGKRYSALFAKRDGSEHEGGSPDFEWRTFAGFEGSQLERILALQPFDERHYTEDYFLSLTRTTINLKPREGGLKVKGWYNSLDGIDKYYTSLLPEPIFRKDFVRWAKKVRYPILSGLPKVFTAEEIVDSAPDFPNPYVMHIPVKKDKKMFIFPIKSPGSDSDEGLHVGVELNFIEVFGRKYTSIGIEGKSASSVRRARDELGLFRPEYPPMDYNKFLEKAAFERFGNAIYDNMWLR